MMVSTKLYKKVVFFSVIPIAARFLEDPFLFNIFSTRISYHIYLIRLDLISKIMFEGAPAAGYSMFHILDSSTNNFFLAILLIVIFLLTFSYLLKAL